MYNESYLRFSSQEFTLVDFHESVHLTNHAVQKRYKNGQRDERLPRENMWDCHTFQAYLRQIGKAEMWSEKIYPGMQKALIGRFTHIYVLQGENFFFYSKLYRNNVGITRHYGSSIEYFRVIWC